MLEDYQIKTLMLMHELEKTLGTLYVQLAVVLPKQKALWDILANEETEHAEAVRSLYRMTYEGKSLFKEGAIKTAAIQSVIDYINSIIDTVKRGNVTPEKALTIVYDIEKSLLEQDMFKCFDVSTEFYDRLQDLLVGSTHHVYLIKSEMDKIKASLNK